jgi:hypothetical protein
MIRKIALYRRQFSAFRYATTPYLVAYFLHPVFISIDLNIPKTASNLPVVAKIVYYNGKTRKYPSLNSYVIAL